MAGICTITTKDDGTFTYELTDDATFGISRELLISMLTTIQHQRDERASERWRIRNGVIAYYAVAPEAALPVLRIIDAWRD